MELLSLHPWEVTPEQALSIQEELGSKVVLKPNFQKIAYIAGADVAYSKAKDICYGVVIVLDCHKWQIIEERHSALKPAFPYIPGLLAFREAPVLIEAFKKIVCDPDVIIFDAHGIAHPRRMGLATHLGIILNKPTIGCAKSLLFGESPEPENKFGAFSFIKQEGDILGASVRTKEGAKPVFVSPGCFIDLKTSLKVVLNCARGDRLPEPTRYAHNLANKLKHSQEGL